MLAVKTMLRLSQRVRAPACCRRLCETLIERARTGKACGHRGGREVRDDSVRGRALHHLRKSTAPDALAWRQKAAWPCCCLHAE
eukprot:756751-Prymnesium_polylepis.1